MALLLLTKREAAKRARVHVATLNGLLRNGQGPALTRIGGKTLIREDRLTAWIDAVTTDPQPAHAAE